MVLSKQKQRSLIWIFVAFKDFRFTVSSAWNFLNYFFQSENQYETNGALLSWYIWNMKHQLKGYNADWPLQIFGSKNLCDPNFQTPTTDYYLLHILNKSAKIYIGTSHTNNGLSLTIEEVVKNERRNEMNLERMKATIPTKIRLFSDIRCIVRGY